MTLKGLNQILAFYGHPAANRPSSSLRFDLASVTDLELAPGSLGGVPGWWSLFNLPRNVLAEVVVDFARALVPGGQVLLGTHVGEQASHVGRPTAVCRWPGRHTGVPERLVDVLVAARLEMVAEMRFPASGDQPPQVVLAARRPRRPSRLPVA